MCYGGGRVVVVVRSKIVNSQFIHTLVLGNAHSKEYIPSSTTRKKNETKLLIIIISDPFYVYIINWCVCNICVYTTTSTSPPDQTIYHFSLLLLDNVMLHILCYSFFFFYCYTYKWQGERKKNTLFSYILSRKAVQIKIFSFGLLLLTKK